MKKQRSQESKKRIKSLSIVSIFIILLFIATTYAWFSTQKNVSINNLKGIVEVAEGLQISLDAESWGQEINLGESEKNGMITNKVISNWAEYDTGIGEETRNFRPIMNGVSGSGDESTGYMEVVSSSGKIESSSIVIPFYTGVHRGNALSKITSIKDESSGGYYAFDIYLMNTTKERNKSTFSAEQQELYFDEDGNQVDPLQLNFNSLVREIRFNEGNDYGLKNCVRIALALYDKTTYTEATKQEVIDGTKDGTIKQVAIWEPNYDQHSAYVMRQNKKLRELADNIATNAPSRATYAVKTGTGYGSKILNIYSDDDENLELQKVNQTSGNITVGMLNEVEVDANTTGVIFLEDTNGAKFNLMANTISKVRVYIWLEGQDIDCVNWASHSNGIDVVLGLCKGSEIGTTTEE